MSRTEPNKSVYAITLLFMFLFGSLMTLLYLDKIAALFTKVGFVPAEGILILFILGGMLNSSLNGVMFLPVITALMGATTSLQAQSVFDTVNSSVAVWRELIFLCIILPLYFTISAFGMEQSCVIRKQIRRENPSHRKNEVISYFIMLTVLAAIALLIAGIVFI